MGAGLQRRREHRVDLRWTSEASDWWSSVSLRQIGGGLLGLIGAAGTVLAAMVNSQNQLFIAVLAVIFQGASAWTFAGVGKVDPSHAKRSVAYLVRLGRRADGALNVANEVVDRDDVDLPEAITTIRELGVHLSYIQEYAVESVEDWLAFNPELRDDLQQQGE